MMIRITTGLEASPEKVFEKLLEPPLFLEVATPLISLKPVTPKQFPEKREAGKEYVSLLFFLRLLPLGKHAIRLLDVDWDKLRHVLRGGEPEALAERRQPWIIISLTLLRAAAGNVL